MQEILVSELKPHPKNDYFFDDMSGDKWNEFVESVRTSGVIEPIVITQEKIIVSGHQRVRACKELGITSINAEVRIYNDEDAIIKDLLETNVRQRGEIGGSTVKLGRRIMELERLYGVREGSANPKGIVVGSSSANGTSPERQFTESELASKLGIGVDTLKRAKKLASLPSEIQDLVSDGNISASTASRLIARLSPAEQEQLAASLPAAERLTQTQVQEYIDALKEAQAKLAVSEQEKENLQVELSTQEAEYQKQLAAMAGQVKTVTVTEYPDDYDELQNLYARYVAENQRLRDENQQTTNTVRDLQSRLEHYTHHGELQNAAAKLESDAMFFHVKCNEFITAVGGYLYLAEHIAELPKPQQEAYWQSVMSIAAWAQNILSYREELLLND